MNALGQARGLGSAGTSIGECDDVRGTQARFFEEFLAPARQLRQALTKVVAMRYSGCNGPLFERVIMKITVIRTGYVGLVSGACLAEVGNNVLFLDLDAEKIRVLEAGHTYLRTRPAGHGAEPGRRSHGRTFCGVGPGVQAQHRRHAQIHVH